MMQTPGKLAMQDRTSFKQAAAQKNLKSVKTVPLSRREVPLWRRLPQLINHFWRLANHRPGDDCLDYDPFNLRVFCSQRYSRYGGQQYLASLKQDRQFFKHLGQKEMDLETFKLVLEQVPGVKTVEFSGRGEPLLNPDLFEMIQYAHQYNGAETLVVSNGQLLDRHAHAVLDSPLSSLYVTLHAHKPSLYNQLSGQDAHNFLLSVENVKHLVQLKRQTQSTLRVMVTMTVDVHTFRHLPDMVDFARNLGVDGVVVENYLSPDPMLPSERSLYVDQDVVVEFLEMFRAQQRVDDAFEVMLPTLLERDMSQHRHCTEPYTTVAVDGGCVVHPCSRQLIEQEANVLIWEENFWNHDIYQQLRSIHGNQSTGAKADSVPLPCQSCPRNLPCSR